MSFSINKNSNEITVSVNVESRSLAKDPIITINTGNVLDFLVESGYNLKNLEVIKEDEDCTNYKQESKVNGEWVFRLKEEKKVAKQTKTTQRRRRRTTKKSNEDKLLGTKDMGGVQSQAQTDLPRSDKEIPGE